MTTREQRRNVRRDIRERKDRGRVHPEANALTTREALADICRQLCGPANADQGLHDDACSAIRSAVVVDVEALADAVYDALDDQHDNARHIHASECCWPFAGVTAALTESLAAQCSDCDGQGEISTGRDYFGVHQTTTCAGCNGTGDTPPPARGDQA